MAKTSGAEVVDLPGTPRSPAASGTKNSPRPGWMSDAWLTALTERAGIGADRLDRGPTYADRSRLADVVIEPGSVSALVRQSRRLSYDAEVTVRPLSEEQWERVVAVLAGNTAMMAAAVEGDLDPALLEMLSEEGLEMLPRKGDVKAHCNCPDDAKVCKHAAGLMHLMADELRQDPLVLFSLRGLPVGDLMTRAAAARSAGDDEGTATADPNDVLASSTKWTLEQAAAHHRACPTWDSSLLSSPALTDAADDGDLDLRLPTTPAPPGSQTTLGGLTRISLMAIRRARGLLAGTDGAGHIEEPPTVE